MVLFIEGYPVLLLTYAPYYILIISLNFLLYFICCDKIVVNLFKRFFTNAIFY